VVEVVFLGQSALLRLALDGVAELLPIATYFGAPLRLYMLRSTQMASRNRSSMPSKKSSRRLTRLMMSSTSSQVPYVDRSYPLF
jgi:hypothetical protein